MALKAIDINEVRDFSLPDDKENPTIFKLGVLDSRIRASIQDQIITWEGPDKIASNKFFQTMREFVRFGLKGFKNFLDKDGKELQFKTETVHIGNKPYEVIADSILDIMPQEVIMALAGEISKENKLKEAERKNSD